MSNAQLAFIEQRRSTRIDRAIPITVYGANLLQEPYQELVSTLTVSYHGCRYRTKYELVRGDVVYLEVNQPETGASAGTQPGTSEVAASARHRRGTGFRGGRRTRTPRQYLGRGFTAAGLVASPQA